MTQKMPEKELPPFQELIIRAAWLINYLCGQISNCSAQYAMVTTAPHATPARLADSAADQLQILKSLREILGLLRLELDPQVDPVFQATVNMIDLCVAETAGKEYECRVMKFMTEQQLNAHVKKQLRFIKSCQTQDTIGTMLVIFGEDNNTQYGGTIDPETTPVALRELADRIERRETVKR